MDSTLVIWVVIILAVLVVVALVTKRRRTNQLKSRFGPEYTHALEQTGSRIKTEAQLHERETRVGKLPIRPISSGDRDRFVETWRRVQEEFVDDPQGAVTRADSLLGDVMTIRGYPVSDFEQRSADLSVDYPIVVQNYRAAHDIAIRHRRGEAGTEDLRRAMIHYRSLFEELVQEPTTDVVR